MTTLNAKQIAYVEGFLYYEAYMAVVGISNHRGTIKFLFIFQKKSLVINHALNNIIVALVSLSHIPQQLRLSSSICNPPSIQVQDGL